MSLICHVCYHHPFPALRTCQEGISRRVETYNHNYIEDSYLFRDMAATLSAYVESLQQELEIVNGALGAARSLSAPASRVPDDVLLYIFQHMSFFNPTDKYDPVGAFYISCLDSVVRVCKRWRHVVISTPMFWTKLMLLFSLDKQYVTPFLRSSKIHLNRAGTLPLMLDISPDLPKSLLNALGPHLDRITSLRITPDYETINEVFNSCSLLSNITRLTFNMWALCVSQPNVDLSAPIAINLPNHAAPRLTFVDLDCEPFLHQLTLPWAQLTTLRIRLEEGGSFDPLPIFTQLERIEHLHVDFGYKFSLPSAGDWSSVTLPRLRTISLVGQQPSADISFQLLQQSNLPALEELRYHLPDRLPLLIEALNAPQLQSIIKLELELKDFVSTSAGYHTTSLPTVIQEFQQLESFRCHLGRSSYSAESILMALSRDSEEVFPRLATLDITLDIDEGKVYETLQHLPLLLQVRVSPIDVPINARKTLKTVTIYFPNKSVRIVELPKDVYRPTRYNDRVTSVKVQAQYSKYFLEEIMIPLGLSGSADRFVRMD